MSAIEITIVCAGIAILLALLVWEGRCEKRRVYTRGAEDRYGHPFYWAPDPWYRPIWRGISPYDVAMVGLLIAFGLIVLPLSEWAGRVLP